MNDRFVTWARLPDGQKQDAEVRFRCTRERKAMLDAFAGQDRTVSDVIREALEAAGVWPRR